MISKVGDIGVKILEVQRRGDKAVVRLRMKKVDMFPSGSADLRARSNAIYAAGAIDTIKRGVGDITAGEIDRMSEIVESHETNESDAFGRAFVNKEYTIRVEQ